MNGVSLQAAMDSLTYARDNLAAASKDAANRHFFLRLAKENVRSAMRELKMSRTIMEELDGD